MMYRDLPGEKALAASQFEKEREYWQEKLSGELEKSSFPPDAGTSGKTEKEWDAISFQLPPGLNRRLMTISGDSDSRLHMLLVTGLSLLLYKYTGQTDIIIGTPIDKQEIEGEFINTILPIRTQIEEHGTVKEYLLQVKQVIIEAGKNQNYPIETIPYDLDMPAAAGEFPLFAVALVLENIQDPSYLSHINLEMIYTIRKKAGAIEGVVRYNTGLYTADAVQRIINHYIYLLQEAYNQVEMKLVEVPVLTAEEKRQVLEEFNRTHREYPRHKMIHRLTEEQAGKTPGNLAVEWQSQSLTYKQLNEKANRLARRIKEQGIGPGDTVAIISGSTMAVPLAIMGVLKSGAAYLPIGTEIPPERIDYLLEDSQAKLLITGRQQAPHNNPGIPVLDLGKEPLDSGSGENLPAPDDTAKTAYIIYTSGTTGQPKGVMIHHRALVNYTWWAAQTYVKNEKVDFPLYTSISFDLTVTSIFTPLITGNAIIVYGGTDRMFYIEEVIENNRVGVVKLTPSHLKLISTKKLKETNIKRLIVGGEELETQLASDIYNNFAREIEIYNEYGPTETVVGSMIYRYDPVTDRSHTVPIGKPIANTRVYLLNRHHQPVPVGVVAELYIAGDGLARGYHRNPALTAEKFIDDPIHPGQKMYKTGDLAVRHPDGNIEYKGRIDHQVKIRGHRVETGEIESKILQYQRKTRAQREQKENVVEKLDLASITRCKQCLIPVNYPGGIQFDDDGVCEICREFETYKEKALDYFKTIAEFDRVLERAQKTKRGEYDCLMLYSGGKDSSYVLHRLVDRGLKVLAFTFDNGYISATCWENIARTTALLDVHHVVKDSQAMQEIFVESLWSDYNVCNGCFKAVNTIGTKLAHEHNINLVISGLTRGQIFDIKLHGLFKLGTFREEEMEERMKLFRQNYHSMTHRTTRLIGVEITEEMLAGIYFADYYRYESITTNEIFAYLQQKDPGWKRPVDTGTSSSNCIINDVGIYVHLKDKGCHFYAAQLSWDTRLGTLPREEGIEELTGYKADYPRTRRVLEEIGYYEAFTGAVVTEVKDQRGEKTLSAYILADKEFSTAGLREYLANELPDYMLPAYIMKIDKIPLTGSGKVDRKALPEPRLDVEGEHLAPRNETEKKLAAVWSEVLGLKPGNIGIDINFFEVGGHSLRATFLAASIQKEFDVKVPLVKIFETPTIRGLAGYIQEEAPQKTFESINAIEKREYYKLSSAQKRLYFLQQMDLNSTSYNVTLVYPLGKGLKKSDLETTLKKLIQRHENLRTFFDWEEQEPVQRIKKEVEFTVQYYEAGETGGGAIVENYIRPFDLGQAPLFRSGIIKLQNNNYIWVVDMHHIVTDGTSLGILTEDFLALHTGEELPGLKLQYKDFAHWQNYLGEIGEIKTQEEYWLELYSDAREIPRLNLPVDHKRPAVFTFAGDVYGFSLGRKSMAKFKDQAIRNGGTLYMNILAALNVLFYKYTGQTDIIIGSGIVGRSHIDLSHIIGIFINALAMRNFPQGEKTYETFLKEVIDRSIQAFDNQDVQFEELVDKLDLERDPSRNPLFDISMVVQNYRKVGEGQTRERVTSQIEELPLPDEKLPTVSYKNRVSKFDMTFFITEIAGSIRISLEYYTGILKEETVKRMLTHFSKIVEIVSETPAIKLKDIEILSGEEKQRVLTQCNETARAYPGDQTIHGLYAAQAKKSPHAIALKYADQYLTYSELNREANRLAGYLHIEIQVQPEEPVGILLERSLHQVTAMLAVLKAGGAYLPIDAAVPAARIKQMLEDAGVRYVITQEQFHPVIEHLRQESKTLKAVLSMEGTAGLPAVPVQSTSLAYVIYTSGSTGMPKGVMVEHKNVIRLVKNSNYIDYLGIKQGKRFLPTGAFAFDITTFEIWGLLLNGASLYLAEKDVILDARQLQEEVEKNKISMIHFIPQLYKQQVAHSPGIFRTLEYMLIGGDLVKPGPIAQIKSQNSHLKILHMYGPTENTTFSTFYPIENETDLSRGLPIGKPISNSTIYILDPGNRPQAIGVFGELCTGGEGVARGYLNQPELTWEKFKIRTLRVKSNAFGEGEAHEIHEMHENKKESGKNHMQSCSHASMQLSLHHSPHSPIPPFPHSPIYHTGDLARWLPDGNIEFYGRRDQQVKLRGVRIELGEIETRLMQHPLIKEAVVIDREDRAGEKYLAAYFITDEVFEITQLKEYLATKLPGYMVPAYYIRMDKIPLTPSGKIDRKRLPKPGIKVTGHYIAPGSALEEKLAEIWSEVLGIEKRVISINADFFDIGGHSLKATAMVAKIHKTLNVKLPLAEIFRTPTIRGLSVVIKGKEEDKYASIKPAEKKDYYPLSSAQKRLYILQQMEGANISYNMPNVLPLAAGEDIEKLEKTFKELITRHESLRTSFEMQEENLVQRIHPASDIEFTIENYEAEAREYSGIEPELSTPRLPVEEVIRGFVRPFNLKQPPLLRAALVNVDNQRRLLLFDMHHIISDGTSNQLLTKEFIRLYTGKELSSLELQYKDYTRWQQRMMQEQDFKQQESFWINEFAGEIPVLEVLYDIPRPAVQSFEGSATRFELSQKESAAINKMARSEGTTLFMALKAAYNIFLHKISSQEDIVVGVPTAGRRHADLEKVIGMFINTLAVRSYPRSRKRFKDFLREVREKTIQVYENQDYPFEDLVEKVAVERDMSRNPLFDVMFVLQNIYDPPAKATREPGQRPSPGENENAYAYQKRISKFDLTLMAYEKEDKIAFEIEYCTKLFRKETIARFVKYFKNILSTVIENPVIKISGIEIITEDEKTLILSGFNNTETGYPCNRTIHGLFAGQAERTPDHIAVIGPGLGVGTRLIASGPGKQNIHLTYRQLNEASNRLVLLLKEKGVGPDTIVGISLERSIEMIIGILGIVKAGGAYLPLDNQYPTERIKYMLEDSAVKLLITTEYFIEKTGIRTETMEMEREELYKGDKALPVELSYPTTPAYIIYTSGSTGRPKGVIIEHRSLLNLCRWHNQYYGVTQEDNATQYAGVGFDASIWEIFPYLTTGATVHIIHQEIKLDIVKLNEYYETNNITICFLPTQICERFMAVDNRSLRILLTGGDKLHNFRQRNYMLYNNYGPTENTVVTTACLVDNFVNSIPIGQPIDNSVIYITGGNNTRLQPVGIAGELCISGDGMARGYLNNPERTGEAFARNPYEKGKRMYRTGDLARWLPDGNIEFLGRVDLQVKIRGYRIEPGEVEYQLKKHDAIKEAVVIERQWENRDNYLAAYIVANREMKESAMKDYLGTKLPQYMIPSFIIHVEHIPITPNGKVDRKALPEAEIKAGEGYIGPGNETEEKLAEIWAEVLALGKGVISMDANFFDLGGHSLRATVAAARIHKVFSVKLLLSRFFKTPTIEGIARYITRAETSKYDSIRPGEEKEYYPLSSAQKRMFLLNRLKEKTDTSDNTPIVIIIEGSLSKQSFEKAAAGIVKRHDILRTSFDLIGDTPVQRVHRDMEIAVDYYEKEQGGEEESEEQKIEKLIARFIRPFDLSKAPLVRVGLVKFAEQRHLLLYDIHHIITDGRSTSVFVNEFRNLYGGEKLPPLKIQYKDYTGWQEQLERSGKIEEQEKYWRQVYSEEMPRLNLPLDFPRPTRQIFEGDTFTFELESELTAGIKKLVTAGDTTLYIVLLSILNVLLSKYGGQEDIAVGTSIAGRTHTDLDDLIGFFVNTLAMRNYPRGEKSFREFLEEVNNNSLKAYENQDYQFDELVKDLGIERDPARSPIFDVHFTLQNTNIKRISTNKEVRKLGFSYYPYHMKSTQFDIIIHGFDQGNVISFVLRYCTGLFKRATIEKFARDYKVIAAAVIENIETKLGEITLYHGLYDKKLSVPQADFAF